MKKNTNKGSMAHYTLGASQRSSQALDIQERIIGEETHNQLLKAGLREGMTVWECGCGNGVSTLEMAKIIGPKGHVTAIDQSDAQLARVEDKMKILGLTNITLHRVDLEAWEPPKGVADFVFGRCILMHLKKPCRLLEKSYEILKVGGCALYAESSWKDTFFRGVFVEELDAFGQSVIALGQKKGADYNFGNKLKGAMEEVGFKGVREECMTFTFSAKLYADILPIRLRELGAQLVASGCIKESGLGRLYQIADALPHNPKGSTMHVPMHFVSGIKG